MKDFAGAVPFGVALLALWDVFINDGTFWLKIFILLPLLPLAWKALGACAGLVSSLTRPAGR